MSVLLTYRNSGQRLWDAQDTILFESDFLSDGIANFNGDKSDLQVIQNTPQAMSVLVGIGRAYKSVTVSGVERKERIYNDAVATVAIASNGGGSNRIDAIIARWKVDVEPDGEADNAATVERVAGTGTSPLTDGAIQTAIGSDKFERLADVRVQPAATQIFTADITDTRTFCRTKNIHLALTQNYSLKGESMNDASVIELLKMVYASATDYPEWQSWPRMQGSSAPTADRQFTTKDYVDTQVAAVGSITGSISMFAAKTAPNGWLMCNGAAVSRTTYASLFNAISPSLGTFTVTIASPGVFTLNGHGLVEGDTVFLTTTGALPTGLSANTLYYVISAGLTSNAFELSATQGGAAINTSGSQSGTHTLYHCPYGLGDGSTTFNVPDFRGRTPFGTEQMGGLSAAGRTTAAKGLGRTAGNQAIDISHTHVMPENASTFTSNSGGVHFAQGNNASTQGMSANSNPNIINPMQTVNFIIKT